jgi:hypothetical protein
MVLDVHFQINFDRSVFFGQNILSVPQPNQYEFLSRLQYPVYIEVPVEKVIIIEYTVFKEKVIQFISMSQLLLRT